MVAIQIMEHCYLKRYNLGTLCICTPTVAVLNSIKNTFFSEAQHLRRKGFFIFNSVIYASVIQNLLLMELFLCGFKNLLGVERIEE